MDPKYLAMADAALSAVYTIAPDIFSDVWSTLQEMEVYDQMREEVAAAIEGSEEGNA